jgi:hypothetical protein
MKWFTKSVLTSLGVAIAVGVFTCSPAMAALIIGQSQFNAGNVLPSPITAVSGDLLETSVSSFSGENASALVRNGTTGTAHNTTAPNPAIVWGQGTTTYNFDVTTNTLGYDIAEIRLFSGWNDGRAGQSYNIEYSLIGNPSFLLLGVVSDLRTDGSLLTRTYDNGGGFILSGVDAIRFNQINNGLAGTGTVFREFDILGSASVPEPASIAIWIVLALGIVSCACRRARK